MSGRSATGTFRTSDDSGISFELHPARFPGAPRLALVHPLGLRGSVWRWVIDVLAGQVEVLTYDCRGHGGSERKTMPFTTDLFARDLAELLDHVGWASAAVAGCSLGGCVAQAFAVGYSARLAALGLIDTTAWYGPEAPARWRERGLVACTEGLARMTEFQVSRWFSDEFRTRHPDVVSTVSAIFLDNDVECYYSSCMMLGEVDLRPSQASIRVPTAIVVGEGDYATPVAMSRQLHESIAGATLRILPGVRHLTPIEAPKDIASQLLELVARIRTRSPG
jgi:3-oxoadipate enol-lactonase